MAQQHNLERTEAQPGSQSQLTNKELASTLQQTNTSNVKDSSLVTDGHSLAFAPLSNSSLSDILPNQKSGKEDLNAFLNQFDNKAPNTSPQASGSDKHGGSHHNGGSDKHGGSHHNGGKQSELKDLTKEFTAISHEISALSKSGHDQKQISQLVHEQKQILNMEHKLVGGQDHKHKHHGHKDHHGHKGGHHKPGTPPPSPEPPPPGPNPNPNPNPNPGPEPPPPPGSSKFLIGTALHPTEFGAPNSNAEYQGLQGFDNKIGVQQNEQNMYVNMNKGNNIDPSILEQDLQHGVTPMVSLRTPDYQTVANGGADSGLKQQADALAAALKNNPNGQILLRPDWEMNLNLNQHAGSPQQFVAAWQHMHQLMSDQLQKDGVNPSQVKWVYSPGMYQWNKNGAPWADAAKQLSNQIDYIAADGYSTSWGSAKTPQQIFDPALQLAKSLGKPMMIAETGTSASTTAGQVQYMQELAQYINQNRDTITALSWFSEGQNDISQNPTLVAAFAAMERSILNG